MNYNGIQSDLVFYPLDMFRAVFHIRKRIKERQDNIVEKRVNSYYWIANNDLQHAKASMDVAASIGNYNLVASTLAQAGEKFLKAVIEYYFKDDSTILKELSTHNLKKLKILLDTRFTNIPFTGRELKYLGDYCFEATYPGDNFILVTNKDEIDELIELTERVKDWVDSLDEQ